MDKLQCLYMEDNEADFLFFKEYLEIVLSPIVAPGLVTIDRAESPSQACEILKDRAEQYHIFVADLLFPDDPTDRKSNLTLMGHVAVTKAKESKHLLVVGLSKAAQDHPGVDRKFPGDTFIEKQEIRMNTITVEDVRTTLTELLKTKGYLRREPGEISALLNWRPSSASVELDSIIEALGAETLVDLLVEFAQDCKSFTPHYIAPGYSGAVVLRVTGSRTAGGAIDAELLLKCSRDREKLRQEIANFPSDSEPCSHVYVHYASKEVRESNGWHASAWRFRDEAKTFLGWISSSHATEAGTREVLDTLFMHGLAKSYVRGKIDKTKSALASIFPHLPAQARIRQAIVTLSPIITKALARDISLQHVDDFLRDGTIGGNPRDRFPLEVYECICHGDLHSRNILVSAKNQPFVIDPARRGERHWASDVARLCVDLWIWAWQSHPDSYFWDSLSAWNCSILDWAYGTKSSPAAATDIPSLVALEWLRDNALALFAGVSLGRQPEVEFRLALVMEFLLASAYQDIPAPKRCLAILTANDLLAKLVAEIEWT